MKEDLTALMQKRRSVFPDDYNGQALSVGQLRQLFDVARYAPSHRMVQPYAFKVFTKEYIPELILKLEPHWQDLPPIKQKKTRQKLEKSAAIAFILQRIDDRVPDWENVASVAMAVQNVWLTMANQNIGCYWSSPGWATSLNETIGLAETQKCLGLLYIGPTAHYPEEIHPMREELQLSFNTFS